MEVPRFWGPFHKILEWIQTLRSGMASTYLFRNADHKKDCIVQSMQLSREMFPKNPPRNKTEHNDALLYLGMVYLIENTVGKKVIKAERSREKQTVKIGLDKEEMQSFLKLREQLRKTVNKFFDDPTRTTLWLSAI
jgi:uncharacterized protein (DUF2225 family)